jgi:chemotaxis protein MotB
VCHDQEAALMPETSFFQTVRSAASSRKKKQRESLWLISYADLTTILVAFFVLMLSMSQVSKQKFDAFSQPLTRQRTDTLDELKKQIDSEIHNGGLQDTVVTEIGMSGLMVEFLGGVLFETGSDELSDFAADEAMPILEILKKTDRKYYLSFEGHTDDVGSDALNWALSSARGVALLNKMRDLEVPQERMSVAGFGSSRPKVPVAGKTGIELENARAANRRVVIRVFQ